MATNGRPPSKPIEECSNQRWCSSPMQFPCDLLSYDGWYLLRHDWWMPGHSIYGRHPHILNRQSTTRENHQRSPPMPKKQWSIPEANQMRIWQDKDWISRNDHQTQEDIHGSCKTSRNTRLACLNYCQRNQEIPRFREFLLTIYPRLFTTGQPNEWFAKERPPIPLDWCLPTSFRHLKQKFTEEPVLTMPNHTKPFQIKTDLKISNWCSPYATQLKWWPTSHLIYLQDIYPCRAKLWHLWLRTPCYYLGTGWMVTLHPRITSHNNYPLRPQKPHLLPGSEETHPATSPMVPISIRI